MHRCAHRSDKTPKTMAKTKKKKNTTINNINENVPSKISWKVLVLLHFLFLPLFFSLHLHSPISLITCICFQPLLCRYTSSCDNYYTYDLIVIDTTTIIWIVFLEILLLFVSSSFPFSLSVLNNRLWSTVIRFLFFFYFTKIVFTLIMIMSIEIPFPNHMFIYLTIFFFSLNKHWESTK